MPLLLMQIEQPLNILHATHVSKPVFNYKWFAIRVPGASPQCYVQKMPCHSTLFPLTCDKQVNGTDAQHCQCYIRQALAAGRVGTAHSDCFGLDLI